MSSPMDCAEADNLIDAYVSRELTPPAADAVAAHVDSCATCAAAVAQFTVIRNTARDLRQRVHIVAETHEIARYYQAADIFVCTSRVESFPRVVLEAMFFGLPVISTRVFGVVEQVSENVNGLLYEPNDIQKLTSHLRQLIDDDSVRARLAANSQPMLATLNTFDEMAAAYAEIFREAALASAQSSGARAS